MPKNASMSVVAEARLALNEIRYESWFYFQVNCPPCTHLRYLFWVLLLVHLLHSVTISLQDELLQVWLKQLVHIRLRQPFNFYCCWPYFNYQATYLEEEWAHCLRQASQMSNFIYVYPLSTRLEIYNVSVTQVFLI
jgi:hypothetical protein